MHNFMFSLDEACIMADAGGNIIIIGADDREKYKKILADRLVDVYAYYNVVCIYYICYMKALI